MQFNIDKFREKLQNQEQNRGKKKADKRVLNYFNMDFGQSMRVRLLPDGDNSGDLFKEYATHGNSLKGVKSINCCYSSSGESCPVCLHSFEHKDTDDEERKRWATKRYTIGQVLVIDSPVEIQESDDSNPIKLFHIPYGIKETIMEAIMNGENPFEMDLIIKKSKKGTNANYDKSHFDSNTSDLPEEFFQLLENGVAYLYDVSKEIPDPTNSDQLQEWFDKAYSVVHGRVGGNQDSSGVANGTPANTTQEADSGVQTSSNSPQQVNTDSSSGGDTGGVTSGKVDAKALLARLKGNQRS